MDDPEFPLFFSLSCQSLKSIIETQHDTYWYEVEDNDDNDGKTPQKKERIVLKKRDCVWEVSCNNKWSTDK